jgi:rhodanese-related sulfurtransferase
VTASDWPPHLADIVAEAREEFGVPTVSVVERGALPAGTVVVDVRTAEESAVSSLPGARRLSSKSARKAFLAEKPAGPVLVYCTAGWRSAEFTRDLRKAGVEAYNLEGGICAWALYGQSVVDDAGQETRRIHGYSSDWADCVPEGYEAVW